jgi:hypothetical protein
MDEMVTSGRDWRSQNLGKALKQLRRVSRELRTMDEMVTSGRGWLSRIFCASRICPLYRKYRKALIEWRWKALIEWRWKALIVIEYRKPYITPESPDAGGEADSGDTSAGGSDSSEDTAEDTEAAVKEDSQTSPETTTSEKSSQDSPTASQPETEETATSEGSQQQTHVVLNGNVLAFPRLSCKDFDVLNSFFYFLVTPVTFSRSITTFWPLPEYKEIQVVDDDGLNAGTEKQ